MQFKSITLRDAVTGPNSQPGLLNRSRDFVSGADLTISRDGDVYVLTGPSQVVEVPSALVLFAVRFPAVVADNIETLAQGKRKRNG